MSLCKNNRGIAGNIHALKLIILGCGFGIGLKIQSCTRLCNFSFKIKHTFFIDFPIQRRMPQSALLPKFRKDTRLIEIQPLLRHTLKRLIPHAASSPVGDNCISVNSDIFGCHRIVLHLAFVKDFKILDGMTGQFGKRRD